MSPLCLKLSRPPIKRCDDFHPRALSRDSVSAASSALEDRDGSQGLGTLPLSSILSLLRILWRSGLVLLSRFGNSKRLGETCRPDLLTTFFSSVCSLRLDALTGPSRPWIASTPLHLVCSIFIRLTLL